MSNSCRWCTRPAQRTIIVEGPDGAPRHAPLCERHLSAVEKARESSPAVQRARQLSAEMEAWVRVFGEPAPFSALTD